jgi:hypothetical protein
VGAVAQDGISEIDAGSKVLDRVLSVLARTKQEVYDYLSAEQLARRLTDNHKVATEASAVRMACKRAPRGLIHVKKMGRAKVYAIMKNGEAYLARLGGPRVVLIQPEKAYTSRRKVGEIFQGFSGVIKICDSHVDPKTIDPLTAIPNGSEIRVLTSNVHEEARVRREIEAYRKEYNALEVRVSQEKLHDRYIITPNGFWLVGHSLNGLGKKEAFIVNLGPDIRAQMEALFDGRWDVAAVL